MAIFTRRNALLGWGYLQARRVRRKLKKSSAKRPRALMAVTAASLAGARAFLRSRRGDS
ncbi:MAG TPA: hypothetical protein VLU96_07165 [Gaiellaceae bacterium]|nr:hypothetical protein [Gaiellaceae bacterium]